MKELISYITQNPGEVVAWVLGVIGALMLTVEGLIKIAKLTKTDVDDKLLGKIHRVLLSLRMKLISFSEKK